MKNTLKKRSCIFAQAGVYDLLYVRIERTNELVVQKI